MKSPKTFSRVLAQTTTAVALILMLPVLSSFSSFSNEGNLQASESASGISNGMASLAPGMYVVVGSFKFPENASRYARSIRVGGKTPQTGLNPENGLYYVIGYSADDNLQYAREKRAELRATNRFYNAWILYVGLTLEELLQKDVVEPVTEMMTNAPTVEDETVTVKENPAPSPKVSEPSSPNAFRYKFNVVNATNRKQIEGKATIVDAARSKTMNTVSTNEVHELSPPSSASKEILVICDIFGYAKDQVLVKIDDPLNSEDKHRIAQTQGITNILFELNRNRVGDILTMYNVYFYRNSALMKPESKFELNSLLNMLQENENLEITIHGHTNGNASGKIIKLKDNDENFFEITDNNDEKFGSAKALSLERAKVIQKWLISQGISKKRMQLKGWGGKKMIYGKTDPMAGKNVRVEIEILKE